MVYKVGANIMRVGGGVGRAPSGVSGEFALAFPSNRVADEVASPFAVLKFDNPQSNGLPLWGASGGGVTIIMKWRNRAVMQPGYMARFWWAQGDGNFDGATEGQYGFHPYPVRGYDVANNYGPDRSGYAASSGSGFFLHELATRGLDIITSTGTNWAGQNSSFTGTAPNDVPATGTRVTPGATYTSALQVTRASSTSKTLRCYFNLPNTDSANYVETTITTTYGESDPPSPVVMIGDSPWGQNATYQHEKADGDLLAVKIITPKLSDADLLSEAADFSRMVTSAGASGIWWGRNGFDTGHATHNGTVTCHYGTGRAATILNSGSDPLDQLSLVSI
jgi:hypothetical protein